MDVLHHALQITDHLAATLTELEMHCGEVFGRAVPSPDRLNATIRKVWPTLVADAQNSRVSPNVDYIASLYVRLTSEASITDPGVFTERTDIPWLEFYTAGCGDEARCEDAWVIAELFWGGYVKHLHLTLGWLLMDAIRIQQNLPAITPTSKTIDRFTDYLRWSGPDTFDAESLRALFYEYETQVAG
jgi:hypothetical protein